MIVSKTIPIKKFLIIRVQQSDFGATNSFEKFPSLDPGKLRIHRFDYQEEGVISYPVEGFVIEERMMQSRQSV
jgi:hypothetical protein